MDKLIIYGSVIFYVRDVSSNDVHLNMFLDTDREWWSYFTVVFN